VRSMAERSCLLKQELQNRRIRLELGVGLGRIHIDTHTHTSSVEMFLCREYENRPHFARVFSSWLRTTNAGQWAF
jgi:hypothetical protein